MIDLGIPVTSVIIEGHGAMTHTYVEDGTGAVKKRVER
jgi:hypothetical protein